jgi:hypothetical protein
VRSKKLWWVLTALIGVPVVLLALYMLMLVALFVVGPAAEDYSQRTTFEAKAWRERSFDHDSEWPTRLRMADDLVVKRRLDRLSREEVLARIFNLSTICQSRNLPIYQLCVSLRAP